MVSTAMKLKLPIPSEGCNTNSFVSIFDNYQNNPCKWQYVTDLMHYLYATKQYDIIFR